MNNAIGGVELSSMARGFDVTDTMLKTAPVQLLLARTVCPGKYIVLVTGEVADVQASVDAGGNRGYCGAFIPFIKNKKYCSLLNEGRDCGKKARNQKYYSTRGKSRLPIYRRKTRALRKYYKEKGIKK